MLDPKPKVTPLPQPGPQGRAGAQPQPRVRALPAAQGSESRIPVVILSGGITGLGVLRAFARRGIPAFVHGAGPTDPVRYSRWFRALPGGENQDSASPPDLEQLDRILATSSLPGAVLCACSDDWNRVVAAYSERGSDSFRSVVPSRVALELLQNKGNLARLLEDLGVPMPMTLPIDGMVEGRGMPASEGTFYFLKPKDSQSFLARFGRKGIRVTTLAEAAHWLEKIAAADMEVVLQEYIPGSPAEHFFIDGYADRFGCFKGLFARRRLRIYPPDFGNSTSMVSVPLSEVGDAIDSVRQVFAATEYRGVFSVEFKRDSRDGVLKLLEVNARPWWFVDFAVRCGVDVCKMAYDDACGLEVPASDGYQVGATCIFPYYDYLSVRELIATRKTTWRHWLADVARSMQPVAAVDDPLPVIYSTARVVRNALRNRIAGRAA